MKKIFIPLMTVAVVAALLLGCVPEVTPPPVTPPPVTPPPVTPPPVTPPPVAPPEAPENPFAGIGIKPDGTQYYLAYIPITSRNAYEEFAQSLLFKYMDLTGVHYTMHDPNLDLMAQIAMIEDTLVSKPDGVLLAACEGSAVCPAVDKVVATGIPFISLDQVTHCDSITCNVYNDGYAASQEAARFAIWDAQRRNMKHHIYLLSGLLYMQLAVDRNNGFVETIEAEGGDWAEVTVSPDCGFMNPQACDEIMSVFPAHPEYTGICETGAMTTGAVEGLRTIGKLKPLDDPEHIWFCSYAAYPEICEYWEKGEIDGITAYSPYVCMDSALKVLFDFVLRGNPVPKVVEIPAKYSTWEIIGTPEWDALWGNLVRSGADIPILVEGAAYEWTE